MSETPFYDELEEKWTAENYQQAIRDQYWAVTNTATGQKWLEDDEGNEVFLHELEFLGEVHHVVREPRQTVIYNAEGHGSESHVGTCGLIGCGTNPPKRKFKLFGRNQGINGML